MVSISVESEDITDRRLRRVIGEAALRIYEGPYEWTEFALADFPEAADRDALALVRDDNVWSQLVPSRGRSPEQLTLFRFHFPPDSDNSGFVGWLASLLKRKLGTGIVVTCGYDCEAGGIYDYWACPIAIGEQVIEEVQALRAASAGTRRP